MLTSPKMIMKIFSFLIEVVVRVVLRLLQISFRFLLRKTYGSKRNQLPPITDPILLESATGLAAKIRTRKLKSEDVVRAYVKRIREVNPYINAIVDDRYVDAIEEAKKVDAYLQSNNVSEQDLMKDKPFLGVPFTTKDGIGIKGLIMDGAVVVRKGTNAEEDSDAVAQMKKAGAIPVAVTNVPEILFWMDASNKVYGRTNNPYDLTRIPGGSSGGEGALISSAGSIFGLGNDIGGSIRIPSFFSGIFGHKPTRKTVSNKGQFPASFGTELDNYTCTGPMCRYAVDLLPMLKVLAGENATKFKMDTKVDLKKLKVYYTEDYIDDMLTSPVSEEMKDAVRKVVAHMEKSFGITAQKVQFPEMMKLGIVTWYMKLSCEDGLQRFDELIANRKLNVAVELLKWFLRLSNHTLHTLYSLVVMKFLPGPNSSLRKSLYADFTKLQQEMETTLGNNGILIFPPNVETALYHQEQFLKFTNIIYTGIFSLLGFPVTQCPVGLSKEGLPLGVQIIGNYHNDHQTIALARDLEKTFGGWKSPSAIM